MSKVTETPGGKAAVAVVALLALGLVIFEASHLSFGGDTRVVPPAQVVSESQQQIDAINKMTNLTPEQKKQMIAHEQGIINQASGGAPSQKPVPPPGN